MKPNWYVINARGMLTLCAGENDARTSAADFDLQWPKMAPHRAVQMVEYAAPAASGEQRCQCGERLQARLLREHMGCDQSRPADGWRCRARVCKGRLSRHRRRHARGAEAMRVYISGPMQRHG